jgi:uncharacterized phage-associated protein
MMRNVNNDLERDVDMTPEDIEAEFDHGFVTVVFDEGTLEAIDVADYIVEHGKVDRMGLQKILYFCQSLSLVLAGRPLFGDAMEAWRWGPVVPTVYRLTKAPNTNRVHEVPGGDGSLLNDHERSIVNLVLAWTKDKHALELMHITHFQRPWLNARERAGVKDGENSNAVIRLEDVMADFVRSLDESAVVTDEDEGDHRDRYDANPLCHTHSVALVTHQ